MAFFRYIIIAIVLVLVPTIIAGFVLRHKLRRRSAKKKLASSKVLPVQDWVSDAGLGQVQPAHLAGASAGAGAGPRYLQYPQEQYGVRDLEAQHQSQPQTTSTPSHYYQ